MTETNIVVSIVRYHGLRSLHSPPFSGQTLTGLHWTLGIQNGHFSAVPVQEFSSDIPVLVQSECESNGLSGRTPDGQSNGLAPKQQPQSSGDQWKVQWTPTGLQQSPPDNWSNRSPMEVQRILMGSKQGIVLLSGRHRPCDQDFAFCSVRRAGLCTFCGKCHVTEISEGHVTKNV